MVETREQRFPDENARRAALDVGRSYIVQAPAGSGKTYLLVSRYLALLSCVEAPEDILAMTFTRKAAAEMRERIVHALTSSEQSDDRRPLVETVRGRDRELDWQLVSTPQRLRIVTIDSLCLQLVRQMPWTSGFGAVPDITEDADPLYLMAAKRTIALSDDGNDSERRAVTELLAYYDNDHGRAAEAIKEALSQREQWLDDEFFAAGDGFDRTQLERQLAAAIESELEDTRRLLPADLDTMLPPLAAYAADQLTAREPGEPHALSALAGLEAMPAASADQLDKWRAISGLLLTKSGDSLRKTVNVNSGFPNTKHAQAEDAKKRMTALLEMLHAAPDAAEVIGALQRIRLLPEEAAYGDGQWAFLAQLATVLRLSLAELHLVFQERGCVDFSEVQFRARAALTSGEHPTDIALRLDYEIKHILVDEFQDTSQPQFSLLALLTRGWTPSPAADMASDRSIFLVGDPMQSIYRFRQANVTWFLRAIEHGVGDIPLQCLNLQSNFRSQPGIVDWVNASFNTLFPAIDDAIMGAVTLNSSIAVVDDSPSATAPVTVHPCTSDQQEADTVAAIVERFCAEPQASNADRQLAVLVRNRNHLPLILRSFRRRSIDFHGVDLDSLAQRPVVRDLLSLARALAHPADHVAWLALLRAPWCGLTLAEMLAVADHERERGEPVFLAEIVAHRQNASGLSPGSGQRLRNLLTVMDRAVTERGRFRFAQRLEWVWHALNGPACCSGGTDLEDAAAFFGLVDQFDEGDDIADFAALTQALTKLRASAKGDASSRVQVMTIHQAKGLQFDTVVVAGLGRKPTPDRTKMVLFSQTPVINRDGELRPARLVAAHSPKHLIDDGVYGFVKHIEAKKTSYEESRLLYVACTRAMRSLQIVAAVNRRDGTPVKGSGLSLLWPVLASEFTNLEDGTGATPDGPDAGVPLTRLPDDFVAPPRRASIVAAMSTPDPRPDTDVEYEWVRPTARIVGTLVHQQLLQIAEQGLLGWGQERIDRLLPSWRRDLRRLGVPDDEIDGATTRMRSAVLNSVSSRDGRWMLSDHSHAANELALSTVVDGTIAAIAVDRTFIADGRRWVIDYKTSFHDGADLSGFLNAEKSRYESQLMRYGEAMAAHDRERGIGGDIVHLALYFPLHDKLLTWHGKFPARASLD